MANYKEAIAKVLKHEGGYVNDPDDKGGETYKGISRKNWKVWSGWKIIDNSKSLANFPKCLYVNTLLNEYVIDFYKRNFWVPIGGDSIKDQGHCQYACRFGCFRRNKTCRKKSSEDCWN